MLTSDDAFRRVRFYGAHDLATPKLMERVADVIGQFEITDALTTVVDAIELHNVQKYIENDLLPEYYSADERTHAVNLLPKMCSAVAQFFSKVNDTNCADIIVVDIDYEYCIDLLELLGRYKAYKRCNAEVMLSAFDAAGTHINQMLTCKKLVDTYQTEIRERLLASPQNAECVIRKYLERDTGDDIFLPGNLMRNDVRELLERYLDSPEANANYVKLIETAPSQFASKTGIDAKLKLKAKRRHSEMTQELFKETNGIKIKCEVRFSDSQDELVVLDELNRSESDDGMFYQLSYSRRWLEETLTYPSILNNFQHVFEFANGWVLLNFPVHPAQLGVFERVLTVAGKTDYPAGPSFQFTERISQVQTLCYWSYLNSKGIDLEDVIAWFFNDYLAEEFGALNFSFTRSTREASYLEKVRHLFAEMESVVNQFRHFVDDGEIDPDLLAISSDPVAYKQVPSLLDGKYIYPGQGGEIQVILDLLFSDQSRLRYISKDLKGKNAAALFLNNEVGYDDFHGYQQEAVNWLIELGILQDTGAKVRIAKSQQFRILRSLFTDGAASYFHLSEDGRVEVEAMEKRGWVTRRSSLLTEAEADYFDYFLNKRGFNNGPELRNKYLHGSQLNSDDEEAHFSTYIIVLKLTIALIIKINDEFCLYAKEQAAAENVAEG